jgi:hypothetical protein
MPKQYQTSQTAQAIPLQPKAVSSYRKIWRTIRDNGYDVIPLRGRDGPFKGWPSAPNTDEAIAQWQGKAAGIRMFGSTAFVIDLDVRSDAVRVALLRMLSARWPAFMAGCLMRTSGGTTLALIGQVATARKRRWTARFKSDGPQPHLVEYFTGNDRRYVAVHGYHSEGREYGYVDDRTILNTRLDSLPWFPEEDIPVMIAACEEVMTGLGLEQIVVPKSAPYGEKVYDLLPDMVITLSTGERIRLDELEKRAGVSKIKASASLWDPESKTPDRVLVNRGGAGLALWDTKHGVSHRWAALSPDVEPEFQRQLRELLKDYKHL